MPFTKRELCGAIVTVLFVVSAIIGILTGLPQLIRENAHRIPGWLVTPNVIWVASLAIIGAICVLVILAPWRHNTTSPDEVLSLGPQFLLESRLFKTAERTVDRLSKISDPLVLHSAIMHAVEQEIPTFLETSFGKREKDKYLTAIGDAKSKDANASQVLRVAITYLNALLMRRIDDKLTAMRETRGDIKPKSV